MRVRYWSRLRPRRQPVKAWCSPSRWACLIWRTSRPRTLRVKNTLYLWEIPSSWMRWVMLLSLMSNLCFQSEIQIFKCQNFVDNSVLIFRLPQHPELPKFQNFQISSTEYDSNWEWKFISRNFGFCPVISQTHPMKFTFQGSPATVLTPLKKKVKHISIFLKVCPCRNNCIRHAVNERGFISTKHFSYFAPGVRYIE